MQKGCIQLYYGDGKGKTTAAIGQIVRCVGHGFKVLVYQFLKEPNSGEVSVIKSLPGVEYIENEGPIPFMFNLTPEQQEICNALNRRTEFRVLRTTYGLFDEKGNLKVDALLDPRGPKKEEEK